MRSELLDFLILGLLVVLFASIYRKRASGRLRFWIAGWLFILLHFAASAFRPASAPWQNWQADVSISALILSGICFLLSSTAIVHRPVRRLLILGLLAVPALVYANCLIFSSLVWPLWVAAIAGQTSAVILVWLWCRAHPRLALSVCAIIAAFSGWMGVSFVRHRPEFGLHAILAEIFLAFAAFYWHDFRRLSAGVLTVTLGLAGWSAVFPVGLMLELLMPGNHIPAALWNVPKYFVAFGMILTLLEDEILAAGRASDHYRLLFAANPHPMWIYDPATMAVLKVNDAACRHYGYTREEFLAMKLQDLHPGEDQAALLAEIGMRAPVKLSGPWRHRKKDGSLIQVDIASHTLNCEGRECRFVLVQDVTERQRLHEQLVHQAHHDTLTGLPNRLLLEDRMHQSVARADRQGHRAAIVCLDLDRFKQVNDTFGHAVGDECLKQVSARLTSRLRAGDTVARTGGEEFTLILGELNGIRDAETVAGDLLAALARPIQAGGYVFDVSASMGIAMYPHDGCDPTELWHNADLAMYRAKNQGGNQAVFVSREISSSANEASELEQYMRRMLREDGFALRYQPRYSADGRYAGVEASLRLNHPRLGEISPERFLAIAEECELVVPLGNWVLDAVCRQCIGWQRKGFDPVRVAFNVSPLQFLRSDFSTHAIDTLARYGLDPSWIEMEVTETAVMRNLHEVAQQMSSLAGLGVHFSVSDFGTGYSSLSHLHELPLTSLKIDRSFVERVCEAGGTYSIVQAIVSLAHSLEMTVIAGGIETSAQTDCLQMLGCDLFQGAWLAPPLMSAKIPGQLATQLAPFRSATGMRKQKSLA